MRGVRNGTKIASQGFYVLIDVTLLSNDDENEQTTAMMKHKNHFIDISSLSSFAFSLLIIEINIALHDAARFCREARRDIIKVNFFKERK